MKSSFSPRLKSPNLLSSFSIQKLTDNGIHHFFICDINRANRPITQHVVGGLSLFSVGASVEIIKYVRHIGVLLDHSYCLRQEVNEIFHKHSPLFFSC